VQQANTVVGTSRRSPSWMKIPPPKTATPIRLDDITGLPTIKPCYVKIKHIQEMSGWHSNLLTLESPGNGACPCAASPIVQQQGMRASAASADVGVDSDKLILVLTLTGHVTSWVPLASPASLLLVHYCTQPQLSLLSILERLQWRPLPNPLQHCPKAFLSKKEWPP